MRSVDRPLARPLPRLRELRDTRRGVGAGHDARRQGAVPARPLLKLVEVEVEEAERIPTGVSELDRVLGGGLVPASLVLVGGGAGRGQVDAAADGAGRRCRRSDGRCS